LWKGSKPPKPAVVTADLSKESTPTGRPLRYRHEFIATTHERLEVVDEAIEETTPVAGRSDPLFYYRFQRGRPVLMIRSDGRAELQRRLRLSDLLPDQSVLVQPKDPELYPEVTWVGREFGNIQTFREWSFGRDAAVRRAQPTDLPTDQLLPDASNLGLILHQLESSDAGPEFNRLLKRSFRNTSGLSRSSSAALFNSSF